MPLTAWQIDTRHADAPACRRGLTLCSPPSSLPKAILPLAVRLALRDFYASTCWRTIRSLVTPFCHGRHGPVVAGSPARLPWRRWNQNPKDARLYRALWHTTSSPKPRRKRRPSGSTFPFNTYRYHLANGIDRSQRYSGGAPARTPLNPGGARRQSCDPHQFGKIHQRFGWRCTRRTGTLFPRLSCSTQDRVKRREMTKSQRETAIVIGGSMAELLAARVL